MKQMNYGHAQSVMIVAGERMGLNPSLAAEAKRHLEGGAVHIITAKAMEAEAVRLNEQLRHDASLIAQANGHAEQIMAEYGFGATSPEEPDSTPRQRG